MLTTTRWQNNNSVPPKWWLPLVTTNCYLVVAVFGFHHLTFHNNNKNVVRSHPTHRRNDVPLFSSSSSSFSTTLDNNNPAHGLLYKEQESMLVQRGILEEELMKDNYSPLLAQPIPKRKSSSRKSSNSSSGSGFGSSPTSGGGKRTKGSRNKGSNKDTTVQRPSLSIYTEEAAIYATELEKTGVVRLDHVLEDGVADQLRTFVLQLRQDSLQKVVQQRMVPATDRFADVLLRENRCDLKIPLMGNGNRQSKRNEQLQQQYNIHIDNTDIVESALQYILTQSAIPDTIRTVFDRCRRTPTDQQQQPLLSPVLYELSTLISDPGSQRQTVHPDNPIRHGNNRAPVLLTCFIALQDVTADMGPTVWLPGTHTAQYHELFFQDQTATIEETESPKDHLLRTHPAVLGTLKKGCCAIYDSRILHCGSANKRRQQPVSSSSDTLNEESKNGVFYDDRNSRAIFYFSFRNPEIAYPGNPASIRNEIGQSKITLDQLQCAINEAVALHPQNDEDDEEQQATGGGRTKSTEVGNANKNGINPFPWNR